MVARISVRATRVGVARAHVLAQAADAAGAIADGTTLQRLATLRTGNTPTQMAITYNRHYLLVGNDNSQIANVYNLETLAAERPIRFPPGHYPRSLAASGRSLLAACRVVGPNHTIDRVDFVRRTAAELPSLGVWQNKIHPDTVLAPSPDGASILAVQPDGNLLLYDSNEDTFIIARKDFDELRGPYAASGRGRFVAGNHVLNSSLVPVAPLESDAMPSSFAFVDDYGLLTTFTATAGPGDTVEFTIAARNTGYQESLVKVTDTLPAGVTAVPGSSTTWGTRLPATQVPFWLSRSTTSVRSPADDSAAARLTWFRSLTSIQAPVDSRSLTGPTKWEAGALASLTTASNQRTESTALAGAVVRPRSVEAGADALPSRQARISSSA